MVLQLQDTNDLGFSILGGYGQSNLRGVPTPDPIRLDPSLARCYQWAASQPSGVSTPVQGALSLAVEPLSHHDGNIGVGPMLPFVREYIQTLPPNRKVLLVPAAHGSTALVDSSPLGWQWGVSGNLSAQAVAQTLAAKAYVDQQFPGTRNTVDAILWVQGENDGGGSDISVTYQAYLDALIDGVRDALGVPNLPWVLGQMVPDYLTVATRAAIDAVHRDTPRRKTRTAFAYGPVGAQFDNGDLSHYSLAGQHVLGPRMFDGLARARSNVTGTPPVAPAAPMLTQSGTTCRCRVAAVSRPGH